MRSFIPISEPSITDLEIEYVTKAVQSTWISSLGEYIDRFESGFARFCDSEYAVAVSNGTVAIHLALVSMGIEEGDEVIVPDLSFVATANAVLHAGARPVFADIDPYTLCLDPEDFRKKITSRTKAVMPVHLYGHPANMPAINEIAKEYGLLVIEDAAEAHGATINGKKVGSWGHCATFSFYGNKNITTGEGGMITTDDASLYHTLKYLRDHGMSKEKRYWHTQLGYNYRLTNLQAALGCAQLERIGDIMSKRQQVFEWYQKNLDGLEGISLNRTYAWATNAYWLITLEVDRFSEQDRDVFISRLKERGVDSRPFFYPMSEMPYLKTDAHTPVAHEIYKKGINLPIFYGLREKDVAYICEVLKELLV
jgi:perosamine synthetase